MKGVSKDSLQIIHGWFVGINRQGLAFAQIAKPAAITETHDMIGMGMGEEHRIEPADVFAQHLDAKFRGGIDYKFSVLGGHVNGWPSAMVFRIGKKFRWIIFADDGNALRSAGTEKGERKRHVNTLANRQRARTHINKVTFPIR